MGLGRSPGAITGALSYLAYRYERWNDSDCRFFERSGEAEQREAGERVENVQSLVLFTTAEVVNGGIKTLSYIDNQIGQTIGTNQAEAPMKEVVMPLNLAGHPSNPMLNFWSRRGKTGDRWNN
jgi:hypothetical protein